MANEQKGTVVPTIQEKQDEVENEGIDEDICACEIVELLDCLVAVLENELFFLIIVGEFHCDRHLAVRLCILDGIDDLILCHFLNVKFTIDPEDRLCSSCRCCACCQSCC